MERAVTKVTPDTGVVRMTRRLGHQYSYVRFLGHCAVIGLKVKMTL